MPVVMANCIPNSCQTMIRAHSIHRCIRSRRCSATGPRQFWWHILPDIHSTWIPILNIAAERGIPVVEDCAQAIGAVYKGRMAGSLGTISAFSTMFGKQHCTGGQGGVVFTKNTLLYARIRQVADRGKPHGAIGNPANLIASLNFNQDEMSLAIGRVQLAKLPAGVEGRRRFAAVVRAGVEGTEGVEIVGDPPGCQSSPWFLILRCDTSKLRCSASDFALGLSAQEMDGVYPGYSFYPTHPSWYRDAVVFGSSGLPWSALQQKPRHFDLPNAHETNRMIVRVEFHEFKGDTEARDLVAAIKKIAQFYRAS